jgi:hypothetical protein
VHDEEDEKPANDESEFGDVGAWSEITGSQKSQAISK